MARIPVDPNYSFPTFPRATAATDIFVKEDVQALAAAVSTHVHDGAGKGLLVGGPAAGSITNAMLGADVARDNLLTNGGFEIWQRGVGPFTTPGGRTADGPWVIQMAGSDTISISRDTANADGSGADAACTFVLGTGAGATRLYQLLRVAGEFTNLPGKTLTVSTRIKAAVANAVRVGLWSDGASGTNAYSAFHTGSGAYQTLTVTYAVPTDATQVILSIWFAASCTAYADNAMLVVGSQAANYVPLHPADDFARCLRYYEVVGALQNEIVFTFYGGAGITTGTLFGFKARKAITPTFTKNATWLVSNCGQPIILSGSVDTVSLAVLVTATGTTSYNNNIAGANVVMEANP
jgi:hypothetical protein